MNYWKRWIGDWQRKTRHLSAEEKGLYGELLDHAYSTQEALPLDHEKLYRISGAANERERSSTDRIIASFFTRTKDGYINSRVQEELARGQAFSEVQRERANTRWSKPDAQGEVKPRVNGHKFELESLPDDWRIFCAAERADLDPAATFAKFRDHWIANANQRTAKKSDWLAAWRNWVRKEPRDRNAAPDYSKVGNKFADDPS